jgi:hypothetical protein
LQNWPKSPKTQAGVYKEAKLQLYQVISILAHFLLLFFKVKGRIELLGGPFFGGGLCLKSAAFSAP